MYVYGDCESKRPWLGRSGVRYRGYDDGFEDKMIAFVPITRRELESTLQDTIRPARTYFPPPAITTSSPSPPTRTRATRCSATQTY
jgi:hypothetical protein